MAESTLTVDYDILRREVGRYLGWDRNPAVWDSDQTTDGNDIINAGLRSFYVPAPLPGESAAHQWTFMRPVTTLTTTPPYSTGTIEIASGVVTLTGGTFPATAADGELTQAARTYSVNTRDSDTQLTLDDLTVTVAAGATYVLGWPVYTLPDDFGTLSGPITFQPGTSVLYSPIEIIGEHQIRTVRQRSDYVTYPQTAFIRIKAHAPTVGTRWEIGFWPTPNDAYVLSYRYNANPNTLTSTNKYPLGGMPHSETILESVLAAAERKFNDGETQHRDEFRRNLAASISRDRQDGAPESLGYNADGSDSLGDDGTGQRVRPPGYYVPYNGVTPGL